MCEINVEKSEFDEESPPELRTCADQEVAEKLDFLCGV